MASIHSTPNENVPLKAHPSTQPPNIYVQGSIVTTRVGSHHAAQVKPSPKTNVYRDTVNKPTRPLATMTGFYYHQYFMQAPVPYLHMMGHKGPNRLVQVLEAYGLGQTV